MLNNLLNRGAKDKDIIIALETNVADAQANLESIRERANHAFYKEKIEATAADKREADSARDELVTAQRILDEATGALLAGRADVERQAKDRRNEFNETAWKDAEKASRKLAKAGVEMDALAVNLYLKFEEIMYLNKEMIETATGHGLRLHSSPLARANIEGALRLTLLKAGFKWSAQWDREHSQIVTVGQTVKNGIAAILSKKPSTQDAA
jgi:hypothetical protein